MANPAYPAGAFFKSKMTPLVIERKTKKVARQTALDKAYEAVDARDGKQCQLRGTSLTAGHVDEWRRLERDHLGPRSTSPELRADVDNILTVSAGVHALLQSGALYPVDRYGEETIRVSKIVGWRWRESFFPKGTRHPFRLPKDKVA